MYTKQVCKTILDEFSAKFSAKKFEFANLDWWPVIWIQVAYKINLLPLDNTPQAYSFTFSPQKASLKKRISVLWSLLKYRVVRKTHSKTVIVFTDKNHKTSYNKKHELINQFTDPFLDSFNKSGISYDTADLNDIHKDLHPFLRTFSGYYKNSLSEKILKSDLIKLLTQIDDFCLQKNLPIKKISNLLIQVIIENQVTYRLLKLQFQKQTYRYSLFYCYYNNNCMSVSRASRANGIEAIEYQHSLIADHHFAYKNWAVLPQKSKALFPNVFWVWDKTAKLVIDKNFSLLENKKTIVGGNVYASYFLDTHKKQKSDNKSVLVSLQGLGLPEFILSTIEANNSVKWYLRFHPRYPNDKEFVKQLAAKYPAKIDLEVANEKSLPELFSKVNYHMTCFSGTALEAELFGVRNLIFGKEGAEAYKNQIEEGVFTYVESAEQLGYILDSEIAVIETDKFPDHHINISDTISNVFKN